MKIDWYKLRFKYFTREVHNGTMHHRETRPWFKSIERFLGSITPDVHKYPRTHWFIRNLRGQ